MYIYVYSTPFEAPAPEVFESAREHFRLRAEFRLWYENGEACILLRRPLRKGEAPGCWRSRRIDMSTCIVSPALDEAWIAEAGEAKVPPQRKLLDR